MYPNFLLFLAVLLLELFQIRTTFSKMARKTKFFCTLHQRIILSNPLSVRSNQGCTSRTSDGNPAATPPLGSKSCNRNLPLGPKKIQLYLVLKGSIIFFGAFGAEKILNPIFSYFLVLLCNIGPIVALYSTKLSVRTLKCRFCTSGRILNIFNL